jgi:hypothetical protein
MRSWTVAVWIFALLAVTGAAADEAEKWRALQACTTQHIQDVSRFVVSLEEGARLISESLCERETTDLANHMANHREGLVGSLAERFGSARYVIERELREDIYQEKRLIGHDGRGGDG